MRILRLKDVMAKTGLARSTVYKNINAGTFPRPIGLGGRSVGWIESDVDEWINQRIMESTGKQSSNDHPFSAVTY